MLDPVALPLQTNTLEHALPGLAYSGDGQLLLISQGNAPSGPYLFGSFVSGFDPSPLILGIALRDFSVEVVWR